MSFAEIINRSSSRTAIVHSTWSRRTQVREFVRFIQSASKVELNNLSHIPYAHFLVGGACIPYQPFRTNLFVVVAQEIQHSNTGFHDLSFVLDFT